MHAPLPLSVAPPSPRPAQAVSRFTPTRGRCRRRGAATVEFAVVAPIFFLFIILPIVEFGRAMMVSELVAVAAEVGCRRATIPGSDNSSVTAMVNTNLANQQINGATTTVLVNNVAGDVAAARPGDAITVTVSVPYQNISWLPSVATRYLGNAQLRSTQVMRHE